MVDVKYISARINHHTAVTFPELFSTGGVIIALYLGPLKPFQTSFSCYLANNLVILGTTGHCILSIALVLSVMDVIYMIGFFLSCYDV